MGSGASKRRARQTEQLAAASSTTEAVPPPACLCLNLVKPPVDLGHVIGLLAAYLDLAQASHAAAWAAAPYQLALIAMHAEAMSRPDPVLEPLCATRPYLVLRIQKRDDIAAESPPQIDGQATPGAPWLLTQPACRGVVDIWPAAQVHSLFDIIAAIQQAEPGLTLSSVTCQALDPKRVDVSGLHSCMKRARQATLDPDMSAIPDLAAWLWGQPPAHLLAWLQFRGLRTLASILPESRPSTTSHGSRATAVAATLEALVLQWPDLGPQLLIDETLRFLQHDLTHVWTQLNNALAPIFQDHNDNNANNSQVVDSDASRDALHTIDDDAKAALRQALNHVLALFRGLLHQGRCCFDEALLEACTHASTLNNERGEWMATIEVALAKLQPPEQRQTWARRLAKLPRSTWPDHQNTRLSRMLDGLA
ncbi:uncharacterized protein MONBRDRAFT_5817 [Monosiga brevicollis MX1]|uniref:Uncharacterized protein n=1 Tax=Monosiga brevicollis TaxID=81824 RepID=A9USJ7_MONBE|nr:uncharacterized protein MONBRDRAFT_5817 [Monosiga brevicollis MX1]EDQ92112.1 predicted protein [Monosiga brevicollis MX1]|eukprot:XP_001743398.1 hypothetical protein [Monosiga brevicollis MX1]